MFRLFPRLGRDRRGGLTVYASLLALVAVSAGTLVIDFGRMTVLRTEMQNRADAAVLAGVAQLDGRDGARARATEMIVSAVNETTALGWPKTMYARR